MSSFTRRHYVAIAKLISETKPISYTFNSSLISKRELVDNLICLFKLDNPNFDHNEFKKLCWAETKPKPTKVELKVVYYPECRDFDGVYNHKLTAVLLSHFPIKGWVWKKREGYLIRDCYEMPVEKVDSCVCEVQSEISRLLTDAHHILDIFRCLKEAECV